MKGIVYKITNKINDKLYIGQTIGTIEDRWYHHVYDALVGKVRTKLGRAIRKHGENSFIIEIIEETEQLDEREIYYIALFKSNTNGYNIKLGGEGGPHAQSTKNKISKANAKRIWTDEMKQNMSTAILAWHKERGFVPRSEEFKKRISFTNSQRKMPEKARAIFEAHNKKHSKPVICINSGKEYPSITAACKELGLNDGHLRMHLKGKHSHVKGFRFKFKA